MCSPTSTITQTLTQSFTHSVIQPLSRSWRMCRLLCWAVMCCYVCC